MNLSGNGFEYGGISSERFGGLMIAEIETEPIRAMSGTFSYSSIREADGRHRHMAGAVAAEEPLLFELEIIRERPIDRREARDISRWLFQQKDYQRLYVARSADDTMERIDGEIKRTYLECVFYDPQRIEYADGLHGWKCTCECASQMALQEAITKSFTKEKETDDFPNPMVIKVDTDRNDYVYPQIEVSIVYETEDIQSQFYVGDVNRDGQISSYDVLLLELASTNKIFLSDEQFALADVDGNQRVSTADALRLLQYVSGKIPNDDRIGKVRPWFENRTMKVVLENTAEDPDTGEIRTSSMSIEGVFPNDTLSIDCRKGTVYNKKGQSLSSYYGRVPDQMFLRLFPGTNSLRIYTISDGYGEGGTPAEDSQPIQSVTVTWNNERWIL